MKVSIIMPVYNAGCYLSETINCVLNQTYPDFELIIVDDGSSDNSSNIYESYAKLDKRILIVKQENKGVSSARNTGLKNARGEWICFLDSDDKVTSTWLESYINAINDEIDIIFQGAQIVYSKNKSIYYQLSNRIYKENELVEFIYLWQNNKRDIGSAWSKIFRASVIKYNNVYFNEKIHNYEDWIFLTNVLLYVRSIRTISACNYIYNSSNTLSLTKKKWNASERFLILNARYEAAFLLQKKSKKCFKIYIADISKLLIQAISQVYKENYPIEQRFSILKKYRSYPIEISKFNCKELLLNFLWSNNLVISDFIIKSLITLISKVKK